MRCEIDAGNAHALVEGDTTLGVPVIIIEHDVGDRLLTSQHRRKLDAVVVAMRFFAEHNNLVLITDALVQLSNKARAGHTVADNDDLLCCLACL